MNKWLWVGILIGGQAAYAQDAVDEEKKKPSWSSGLPERKVAPVVDKPTLTLDDEPERPEMKRSDFGFDDSTVIVEDYQPEFQAPTDQSTAMPENNVEPIQENEVETSATQALEVVEVAVQASNPNKSPDSYAWEVLQSEPITVPKTLYYSKKQVRLKVTINPDGEVVKLRSIRNSVPGSVVHYVRQAMKTWRFEAPSAYGISEHITKELHIPIELR